MRAPQWLRTLAGKAGRRMVDWSEDSLHGEEIVDRIKLLRFDDPRRGESRVPNLPEWK